MERLLGTCSLYADCISLMDSWEGAAVLDTKWCLAKANDSVHSGVLGIADATGHLNIMKLATQESSFRLHHWKTWKMNEEKALCLSLDWSDRGPNGMAADAKLILSQSNGTLCMVPTLNVDHPLEKGMDVWAAHDYEAWICAWDCWSHGNIAWSGAFSSLTLGGDDLCLKGWDMRMPIQGGHRDSTFTCKRGYGTKANQRFDGGVTSLQSHPHRPHYWAVGRYARPLTHSYDEKIRIFDSRSPFKPVSMTEVGGGIWRAKWHPTIPSKLLLACMHGGLCVLDCPFFSGKEEPQEVMDIVTRFNGHQSIAYGCDWERGDPDQHLVYSCSFYDATLHIWSW